MLIKPAYAQAAGGEPSFLISLLPLILIFVVFWFLLIRPQQKRMREHREMVAALQKGDKVMTAGGIYGVVAKVVDDSALEVEIAQGVRVRVERATITQKLDDTQSVQLPKPANDPSGRKGAARKAAAKKADEPEPSEPEAKPDAADGGEAGEPNKGQST
ncbi:MAG: preprotein translocase subunit YajC [Pseudomonadota bacterium]